MMSGLVSQIKINKLIHAHMHICRLEEKATDLFTLMDGMRRHPIGCVSSTVLAMKKNRTWYRTSTVAISTIEHSGISTLGPSYLCGMGCSMLRNLESPQNSAVSMITVVVATASAIVHTIGPCLVILVACIVGLSFPSALEVNLLYPQLTSSVSLNIAWR